MFRDDLGRLSTTERLDEVVALLAAGFLRLRCRTGSVPGGGVSVDALAEESSKNSPDLAGGVSEGAAPCPVS